MQVVLGDSIDGIRDGSVCWSRMRWGGTRSCYKSYFNGDVSSTLSSETEKFFPSTKFYGFAAIFPVPMQSCLQNRQNWSIK
jgi:hypothetical protein